MAELAASIIGIVSAGAKVAFVLSQLAADMGAAGREARMISGEIRTLCAVLKTLGETLEKVQLSEYYAHCAEMTKDMTTTSMEMFTEMLDACESIRGMARGKHGTFGFTGRLQWAVFQKPKVVILRAALEAYKSDLALMLGTLNTAEKVMRRASMSPSPAILAQEQQDRSLLESLQLDQQASMLELEQAERQSEADSADFEKAIRLSVPSPAKAEDDPAFDCPDRMFGEGSLGEKLMASAREEIKSIRSSLSEAQYFELQTVQDQVLRHSKRLSALMSEDHKRISQRWSTFLTSSPFIPAAQETHQPTPQRQEPIPIIEQSLTQSSPGPGENSVSNAPMDPVRGFRAWLAELSVEERSDALDTLLGDLEGYAPKIPSIHTAARARTRSPIDQTTILSPVSDIHSMGSVGERQGGEDRLRGREIKRMVREQVRSYGLNRKKIELARMGDLGEYNGLTVDLKYRKIGDIPGEVFDIMQCCIERLSLGHNHLTSISRKLELCTRLRYLNLRANKFETIPEAILKLPFLEVLDMAQNHLRAIPEDISRLRSLKVLSVRGNHIEALPVSLGNMSSLLTLRYEDNPITFPDKTALEALMKSQKEQFSGAESEHRDTHVVKSYLLKASVGQLEYPAATALFSSPTSVAVLPTVSELEDPSASQEELAAIGSSSTVSLRQHPSSRSPKTNIPVSKRLEPVSPRYGRHFNKTEISLPEESTLSNNMLSNSSPDVASLQPDTSVLGSSNRSKKAGQKRSAPSSLNLAAALPTADYFRTELIMPSLSARFSILREQDDASPRLQHEMSEMETSPSFSITPEHSPHVFLTPPSTSTNRQSHFETLNLLEGSPVAQGPTHRRYHSHDASSERHPDLLTTPETTSRRHSEIVVPDHSLLLGNRKRQSVFLSPQQTASLDGTGKDDQHDIKKSELTTNVDLVALGPESPPNSEDVENPTILTASPLTEMIDIKQNRRTVFWRGFDLDEPI